MMRCPYNKNHIFKKEKLYKHLDHCTARKKANKKLCFCKGNSMVVFFEEDKKAHQKNCKLCKPDPKEKEEESFVSKFNNSETQIDLDIHLSRINNDKGTTVDLDLSNDFQSNIYDNKTVDFSKTCQDKTLTQIKNESFADSIVGNILDSIDDKAQQSIYY